MAIDLLTVQVGDKVRWFDPTQNPRVYTVIDVARAGVVVQGEGETESYYRSDVQNLVPYQAPIISPQSRWFLTAGGNIAQAPADPRIAPGPVFRITAIELVPLSP